MDALDYMIWVTVSNPFTFIGLKQDLRKIDFGAEGNHA